MKLRIKEEHQSFYPQRRWFGIWQDIVDPSCPYSISPLSYSNYGDAATFLKWLAESKKMPAREPTTKYHKFP